MLLGLQATAGNAAVADLIETRKPTEISPPPLAADGLDGAAPARVTADAPPSQEAAVAPRAGETDDELAALDAEADRTASISPPHRGESGVRDGQAGELPESQGGGTDAGTPIEERPALPTPDVSAADPASGLARVGSLPPARLLSSLGTVSTAVDRQAATEHERLAANAPHRPGHPGAPATVEAPAATRLALGERPTRSNAPSMPEAHDVHVRDAAEGTLPRLPLEGNADPALLHQQ